MINNNIKKEDWLKRSRTKYSDKFDYSLVKYKNSTTHVAIICKRHGLIMQTPGMHLNYGCKACNSNRLSTNEFFEHVRQIHDNRYDYSKSVYNPFLPLSDMMIITCKIHGDFVQRIQSHQDGHGCPVCKGKNNNVIKVQLPTTVNSSNVLHEDSDKTYTVNLSFNLGKNDINVDLKTDPFPTKFLAEEFINNIQIFVELTNAMVLESLIKENPIFKQQEMKQPIHKGWLNQLILRNWIKMKD